MAQTPTYRGEILLGRFLDFAYENKEVKPAHIALYAHILTTYNKLGWPEWFGIHTETGMQRSRIGNRKSYFGYLGQLMRWGWIKESEGRARTATRQISLLPGPVSGAYGSSLANTERPDAPSAERAAAESPDFERFDRIFGPWSVNVVANDRRWAQKVMKETGIQDFPLAMRLFKEHIIGNSKVAGWLEMPSDEKKAYFLHAAKWFVTDECRTVKEVVATVKTINGHPYVFQYGFSFPLPDDYPPQPDVDYYWDSSWKAWRRS